MTNHDLPLLGECVETYLDLWHRFGDDRFDAAAVVEGGAVSDRATADDPQRWLTMLVAYGLLDHLDDGGYRLRCRPGASRVAWHDRFVDRADTVHSAVDAAVDERTSDDASGLLTYGDRSYVSVFVDDATAVGTVADRAERLASADELHAGLVLRCPAAEADSAQRVADELARTTPSFEKVTSEVAGVDSDALQFRLYLSPSTDR